MIITCPRCFATYEIPPNAVPSSGRKVRCSSCQFEWTEVPPPHDAIVGLSPQDDQQFSSFLKNAQDGKYEGNIFSASEGKLGKKPIRVLKSARKLIPSFAFLRRKSFLRATGWTAFVLVSFLVLVIVFRGPIGHRIQSMADFYEGIGLPVESAADWFAIEMHPPIKGESDGKTTLSLSGEVTNVSHKPREVPRVRVYWLGNKSGPTGPEVIEYVMPRKLNPGEKSTFSATLNGIDARKGGEVKVMFYDEATATGSKSSRAEAASDDIKQTVEHDTEHAATSPEAEALHPVESQLAMPTHDDHAKDVEHSSHEVSSSHH